MGILIELEEQDYKYCLAYANGKTNILALNNTSRVIKAVANGTQYENRLKADMVAMLTELKTEINEMPINTDNSEPFRLGQASAYDKCENLIQQKINELKE